MDYEDDFANTVQETVLAMQKRGKEARTERLSDGSSVVGWRVEYTSGQNIDEQGDPRSVRHGGYWFRSTHTWEASTLLLQDGTFVGVRQDFYEDSKGEERLSRTATHLPTSSFVGNKGKPFSEMKSKLERLPYL